MFKTTILALIVLVVAACDISPLGAPSTNDLMKPAHAYEIDSWGANSEIYEFIPKSNPNVVCIMFMLDSGKAMGLDCFDKPTS